MLHQFAMDEGVEIVRRHAERQQRLGDAIAQLAQSGAEGNVSNVLLMGSQSASIAIGPTFSRPSTKVIGISSPRGGTRAIAAHSYARRNQPRPLGQYKFLLEL